MQIQRRRLKLDSKRYSADQFVPRSDGVHVSHIIHYIETALNIGGRAKQLGKTIDDETREAYFTMGFLMEHVISDVLQEQEHLGDDEILRPGELGYCVECDGTFTSARDHDADTSAALEHFKETGHKFLYLTPDAINGRDMAVEEWKATWMSRNRCVAIKVTDDVFKDPAANDIWTPDNTLADGVWRWPVQVMSYCSVLGLERGNMRVFFVNGDYREKRPEAWTFRIEFTQKEISRNWDMILKTGRGQGWL